MKVVKEFFDSKEVRIEFGPFGWCVRLPNGSAARANRGSKYPRYFKTAQTASIWAQKQTQFVGGGPLGEPTIWKVVCEP